MYWGFILNILLFVGLNLFKFANFSLLNEANFKQRDYEFISCCKKRDTKIANCYYIRWHRRAGAKEKKLI